MTMESRQPEEPGSNTDLIRSLALSSADLWHETLERLDQVQEGQVRLARAIESLGMIVCNALSLDPREALSAGQAPTVLARGNERPGLPPAPSAPHFEHGPTAAPFPAATPSAWSAPATRGPVDNDRYVAGAQTMIDTLLGPDVFTPAASAPPTPGAAVTGVEGTTTVASPLFYIAPVARDGVGDEELEPAHAGSRSRARRFRRGRARDAAGAAVPPDVTALAVGGPDGGFSDMSRSGGSVVTRAVSSALQAAEAEALLGPLLGQDFTPGNAPPVVPAAPSATPSAPHATSPMAASATPPVTLRRPFVAAPPSPVVPRPAHVAAPTLPPSAPAMPPAPSVVPRPQVVPSSAPPVQVAPSVTPRPPAAASSVTPPSPATSVAPLPPQAPTRGAPPVAPPVAPSLAPRPPQAAAVPAPPAPVSTPPPVSPPAPVATPSPVATPAPVSPPETSTVFTPPPPSSVDPTPLRSPLPPPPAPPAPMTTEPAPMASAPPAPVTSVPPPPVASTPPAPIPNPGPDERSGADSARMATEILSASPDMPRPPVDDDKTPMNLAADVTIIARGRRRRFRLR